MAGFGWSHIADATTHLGTLQKDSHLQNPVIFGSFGLTVVSNISALCCAFWKHDKVSLVEAVNIFIWLTYTSQLILTLAFFLTSSSMSFLKGICDDGGSAVSEAQSLFSKLGGADLLGEWLADVNIQLYCDNSTQAGEHVYFMFLGFAITCWSQAMMLSCLTGAKAQARLQSVMWKRNSLKAALASDGGDSTRQRRSVGGEEYRDPSTPKLSAVEGMTLLKEAMRQHKANQLTADNAAQKLEDESDGEKSDISTTEKMIRELGKRASVKKPDIQRESRFGLLGLADTHGSPHHSESSQEQDKPTNRLVPPSNKPLVQLDLSRSNTSESEDQEKEKRSRRPETRHRPRQSERHHSDREDRPKAKKKLRDTASDPQGRKSARPRKKDVHMDDSEHDVEEEKGPPKREHGTHRAHKSRHERHDRHDRHERQDPSRDRKSTRRTHRTPINE